MKLKAISILTLAILAIAAGCGGDSNRSETAASQTSGPTGVDNQHTEQGLAPLNADFVKQASAICVAAKERASEEFEKYVAKNAIPTSGPGVAEKAKDVFDSVLGPVYELQIEKIQELEAPQSEQSEVNAILKAMREGLERAKQQPLQFIRQGTAFSQASKLAVEYGMPACAMRST